MLGNSFPGSVEDDHSSSNTSQILSDFFSWARPLQTSNAYLAGRVQPSLRVERCVST